MNTSIGKKKKKSNKKRKNNVSNSTVKIYSYPKTVKRKIEILLVTSHTVNSMTKHMLSTQLGWIRHHMWVGDMNKQMNLEFLQLFKPERSVAMWQL